MGNCLRCTDCKQQCISVAAIETHLHKCTENVEIVWNVIKFNFYLNTRHGSVWFELQTSNESAQSHRFEVRGNWAEVKRSETIRARRKKKQRKTICLDWIKTVAGQTVWTNELDPIQGYQWRKKLQKNYEKISI